MSDTDKSDPANETATALSGLPAPFADFPEAFDREIRPLLLKREGERTEAIDTARKATWGGVAVAVLGGVGAFAAFASAAIAIMAVAAGVVAILIGRAPLKRLRRDSDAMLVGAIADHLGYAYTPHPDGEAEIADFRAAGLLPDFDRAHFEDRLSGVHGATPFTLFEAKLEDRRVTHRNGRTQTRYVTVFEGQCLRFRFDKRFFGETRLTRDAGFFNRFGGHGDLDRARLEDPEFEDIFEVYTSDQVEARFLLTPEMMGRLVDLERTLDGRSLRCTFIGQEVLLALEDGDLFAPGGLFDPLDDPARIRSLLDDFASIHTLMDAIADGRRRETVQRGDRPA